MPPVFPPTLLESLDQTPCIVHDTSSSPGGAAALESSLSVADAVIVCFDATRLETLDNIRTEWYARISRIKPEIPIIIACCKADLLGASTVRGSEDEVDLIRARVEKAVQDLGSVEVCLNCSSKTNRMVSDVFYYAVKAVLYPLQPLYERTERRLKPACLRGLKRVFRICDQDNDGFLSDSELNGFQLTCFNSPLTPDELLSIKQVVVSKMPSAVTDQGLTLDGFLYLHVLFIEKGRLESTWTVLRRFGYDEQLTLREDLLEPALNGKPSNGPSIWTLPGDQVYELSEAAVEFLGRSFLRQDEDGDGLLSSDELALVFATIPPPFWQGAEWDRVLVPGSYKNSSILRQDGYMLKWYYSVHLSPMVAVSHMIYMGYGGAAASSSHAGLAAAASQLLVKCTRRRPERRSEMSARTSINCLVFGPHSSGKSCLVRSLVKSQSSQGGEFSDPARLADDSSRPIGDLVSVGAVSCADSRQRVLIMTEVNEDVVSELSTLSKINPLTSSSSLEALRSCDVAAFLFDSSSVESFQQARAMMEVVSSAAGETLPCVFIATKDDLGMSQSMEARVINACSELSLFLPFPVSLMDSQSSSVGMDESIESLFRHLVSVALQPLGPEGHPKGSFLNGGHSGPTFIPYTEARRSKRVFRRRMIIGGFVASTLIASCLLYYSLSSVKSTSPKASESSLVSGQTSTKVGSWSSVGGWDPSSMIGMKNK